jgi:hypothetical protein
VSVLEQGYRIVSRVFGRSGVRESIATGADLAATPDEVWHQLMFYEDVPERPAFLLRALLPYPVRAEGDKTRPGATVRCVYRTGDVTKRITTTNRPDLLEFEVIRQRLGIEECLVTRGGSYRISASGGASRVILITEYEAYLRPRFFWRRLEALLIGQLHLHILGGIRTAMRIGKPWRSADGSLTTPSSSSGTLA